MTRLDNIEQQRLEKLARIRERGIDPYPRSYHRTHTTQQAVALLEHQEKAGSAERPSANVAGRITASRGMGKISFLDVRDGSGRLQLLFARERLGEAYGMLKDLDIGDIIGASGCLFRTKTGEPTLDVEKFTILSKSLQPLPEKWHGLVDTDLRYRQRYLDLIANTEVKDVFLVRSRVITAIRQFLNQRGFIEVETPVLQSAAGGALARPFITHHNALDQDFYLRIALELYLKRLIVGGFDKVYELGRTFRNEGISTRHNPEFTMLETYEAYADYNDVMSMVEIMVSEVCQQATGGQEAKFGEQTISFKPPWKRITLRDAVKEYAGFDFMQYMELDTLRDKVRQLNMEVDPKNGWAKLLDDVISTFVQPNLVQPTFLIDYPVAMTPLAKKTSYSDLMVERFEAFAGGIEIANAFTELNDPQDQRQRFEEQMKARQGEDEEKWTIDEDFLTALEYGMPPTGGLGVGIDRLVMLLTNQQSIREVILFPQLKEKG
ncbi:MAG: lysine--tRNA ligase [Chloroflexi bacterium]|nr:lysine--tRNA ligase [Chloroflexota bacterium]